MGWWSNAERAASMEFGRRHYRGIAAFKVIVRVVPVLAVATVIGIAGWSAWHGLSWGAGHLRLIALLVVALLVAAVAALAWRRMSPLIEIYLPSQRAAAMSVTALAVLFGGATAAWIWLT